MKIAKLITLVAGIALIFAVVAVSSASAAEFSKNLTVGSRGADVSSLQQILIDGGYLTIDAPTTYFGAMTKKALMAYQKENGLPSTGYFGPMTRGILNGAGGTTTTTGGTSTVPGCAAGALFSSTTGASCSTGTTGTTGTVSMDGTDGSATLSLNSYVGNQTLKKGETKDIYAVKLQATAGKVTVSRFDVRMTKRPYLYFSKLVLKDTAGTVIAEKSISGAADVTELTADSDYLVRFENVNTVVTPGTDKILVVAGSILATTDKLTTDVTLTVKTGTNGIRTINGKGYTDSLSETTGRTVTLSSSGSIANILGRLGSASPASRIQTVTTSGETNDAVLGVFEYKSENTGSTINTLQFTMNDKSGQKQIENIYKRVYLTVDGRTVYADTVASTTVFNNLALKLVKDEWKSLTLKAVIADADDFTNGSMASTSQVINTTNIVGIDDNYTTVTASGANTVAAGNLTLLQSGVSLSGLTKVVSNITGANGIKGASSTMSFTFTVNNTGSSDVYLSKLPGLLLATSTTATCTVSCGLTLISSGSTETNDTSTYYVLPSNKSRSFTVSGTYGTNSSSGIKTFSITKVYFDDDTTGLQEFNVDYGLEDWYVGDYQAAG